MGGVNNDPNQGFGGAGPNFGGQDFGGGFNDFFDMFGRQGGPFGGQGQRQPQKMKMEPMVMEVQVELEDLFYGKAFDVRYNRMKNCAPCGGKGGSKVNTCGTCHGQGFVIQNRNMGGMRMQTQEICQSCGGVGEVREG
jgi:DnaJ-class molecular chaperone